MGAANPGICGNGDNRKARKHSKAGVMLFLTRCATVEPWRAHFTRNYSFKIATMSDMGTEVKTGHHTAGQDSVSSQFDAPGKKDP